MKLYDFAPAPNPRRVRIFAAEKGLALPTVQINLRKGEQFSDAYRAINPTCVVPFLQLDDGTGTGIGEAVAICRYLEEIQPSPPLLGHDAKSKAVIAMWEHRMESEGLGAVAEILRNSLPAFQDRAVAGPLAIAQIPELVERGRARLDGWFADLDCRLGASRFVAGDDYSMADITALVTVDFAGWVEVRIPEPCSRVKRWYENVSARPSAKA